MMKKHLIKLPMIKTSDKLSFPVLLIMTLIFGVMLLLANFLLVAKTEQALKDSVQNTALTAVSELRNTLTESYTLGIYPETLLNQQRLAEIVQASDRIQSINWYNTAGQWVAGSQASSPVESLSANQIKLLSERMPQLELSQQADRNVIALSIRSTFGQPIGFMVVNYSTKEIQQLRKALNSESFSLFPKLFGTGALLFVLLYFLAKRIRWAGNQTWSLSILSTLGMFVMAFFIFKQAELLIQPLLKERLESIAQTQQSLWSKAYSLGFELNDFEPLEPYFSELENTHKEIGRVVIMPLHVQNMSFIQVAPDTGIALEPNPAFLRNIQIQMSLDYLTLALILFFFWSQFKHQPIAEVSPAQSQQINLLKPMLFLFFLSEEFIRPILPSYAASKNLFFENGLNADWIPSLSISVFMVIVALSQPFLNRIRNLAQARRFWLSGAFLVIAGQALLWVSPWAEGLLISRLLAGLGYACSFVASQSMLLMIYGNKQRVSAFASLVVCIMAATIVGPAFGGLLTDYFGTQAAIGLAIGSPLIAMLWMSSQKAIVDDELARPETTGQNQTAKISILSGITHPKLLALTLFAAVPAKAMLTGLLFFLIPAMALDMSLSPADAGRLILVYGFLMLIGVPYFSRMSNRLGYSHSRNFVAVGLLISSLCGLLPLLSVTGMLDSLSAMTVALPIALSLGLGQAISISSQAALAQSMQASYAPNLAPFAWLGTYRFIERLGNAVGPPVVAILLIRFETEYTLIAFGTMAIFCACVAYFGLKQHPAHSKEASLET